MINTFLAIDDLDEKLGSFYTECLTDLQSIAENNSTLIAIRSNNLNDLHISLAIPQTENVIFLAYSHGSANELLANGVTPYISDTLNTNLFKGSFFYTCSCSTAKKLGHTLIENECASYIGYKEEFTIWDYNRPPFVECANLGYKLFLSGHNISSIQSIMKEKYDEHIDNYTNDFFGAACLLSNKNALVALGNLEYSVNNM